MKNDFNIKNFDLSAKKFISKVKSLISNREKRDAVIKFLNYYIALEYVFKTYQLSQDNKDLDENNYKSELVNVEKLKKFCVDKKCSFDDIKYIFNKRSYKNKKSCRYIRNKIVHCFDEECVNLVVKNKIYTERLEKVLKIFLEK